MPLIKQYRIVLTCDQECCEQKVGNEDDEPFNAQGGGRYAMRRCLVTHRKCLLRYRHTGALRRHSVRLFR